MTRALATCCRWALAVLVVVGPALVMSSGCNSHPIRPADLSGRTPLVRVLLLQNRSTVSLAADVPPMAQVAGDRGARPLDLSPGVTVSVRRTAAGWVVGPLAIAGAELTLTPQAEGTVRVGGRAYRGRFRLVPRATPVNPLGFDVVNDVDVENYLRGVLARELPPDFDPAAYAAQAVVARTYALFVVNSVGPSARHDLFADERSQVYGGIAAESAKASAAVEQTAGQVVAYGPPGRERIFKAYFSACCGGVGQSAADAFGDAPTPPLAAQRRSALCSASPSFTWPAMAVTKADLTVRFRAWGTARHRPEAGMSTVLRIDVAAENGIGRPVRFTLSDYSGRHFALTGEELRTAVNTGAKQRLPSSLLRPVDGPTTVTFANGRGRGHGVGLCQWCAQAWAGQGRPYRQIVTDFYPGSVVLRAY